MVQIHCVLMSVDTHTFHDKTAHCGYSMFDWNLTKHYIITFLALSFRNSEIRHSTKEGLFHWRCNSVTGQSCTLIKGVRFPKTFSCRPFWRHNSEWIVFFFFFSNSPDVISDCQLLSEHFNYIRKQTMLCFPSTCIVLLLLKQMVLKQKYDKLDTFCQ